MPEILRYRPAFFSGYEDEYAQASTQEELLAIPWVHYWADQAEFCRFSVSGRHLMVELDEGRIWFVVAVLPDGEQFGLPERKGQQ